MTSTYTGKLRNVARLNNSRWGNPRFAALIQTDDDKLLPVRTGVDSCLAYGFTNFPEGSRVTVTVKLVRGYWTIQDMEYDTYRRGRTDYNVIRDLASDSLQQPARVSQDEFYEMLECVPPIYVDGVPGFLVGEALTRDNRGTVYANYYESRDGLYCARYHVI